MALIINIQLPKPFLCTDCHNKSFKTERDYKNHLSRAHGIDTVPRKIKSQVHRDNDDKTEKYYKSHKEGMRLYGSIYSRNGKVQYLCSCGIKFPSGKVARMHERLSMQLLGKHILILK